MNDRIYANASLQMNRIKYIGFDMDATLAIYKSPECEKLAFDLSKLRLVELGYPTDLAYVKYNSSFATRAVWFDKLYGYLLKTDVNSNILGAWHGTRKVVGHEIRELYPNKHIQHDAERIFILNTVFNTPEVYLVAVLIDIISKSKKYKLCENKKAYTTDGGRVVSFETIFNDCRNAIDSIHVAGNSFKTSIAADIGKYIEKNDKARQMIKHLTNGGKKVFLLTNSDYNYTDLLMKYVMGPDWISLFDVVIVDGAKPKWFTGNDSFKVVDKATGKLEIGSHNGVLEKGKVYSGGNVGAFTEIVGLRGKDTLYVGDHIFGDVLKSKKVGGWRTLLIIPELNTEIKHIENQKQNIHKLLTSNSDILAATVGRSPNGVNTTKENHIHKLVNEVESVYGSMGSLLRTGWKTTHFAENTRRYADLYTSCSYNLLHYSTHHYFSSPVPLMPHEIDIFTKKDDTTLSLLHAPISVDETSDRSKSLYNNDSYLKDSNLVETNVDSDLNFAATFRNKELNGSGMRSILLILVLATLCVSELKLDLSKELSISNEKLALFQKELGDIDLGQHLLKLRNLASRSKVVKLTKEQEKELNERRAMITETIIEKPPGVNATDLFEINEKSGIVNFLYEGDINLSEEQLNELTKSVAGDSNVSGARAKRSPVIRTARKWPNGIVYYYFDMDILINPMKVDAIKAALQFLEAKTCIRFQHNKVNRDVIQVIDGEGCYSTVGMRGNRQVLSIGDGCEAIGMVAHEFAHALGFDHMHTRFDRDDYITVDTSKAWPDRKYMFDKLTINDTINYTPYEYGGMMQYPVNSATKTPDILNSSSFTMIPKDINQVHTMGNRMISFYDFKGLNLRYNCSAKCPAATSAKCQNGGLPNPNNCAFCYCPLGYAGSLCDQMPPVSGGCGGELTATSDWQEKSFKYGQDWPPSRHLRHQYTECHHWIKAPAGAQIQVRIINMINPKCSYGCLHNGIEFKLKNQRMTNPKICCVEFLNITHTAELNPLPVIAHNRYGVTEFTIEYRHGMYGDCGSELTATLDWQKKSFQYGENTTILRNQTTECHHWIKAPEGSKIQVRIANMINAYGKYGCQYNGIEFKLKDNKKINSKICNLEFLNNIYTAELNPLPVNAYNKYGITDFTIDYRIDPATVPTTTRPAATTTPCPPGKKKTKVYCRD